ncbi:hypothetical protein CHPC929_0054 [Streptococcus phage CHPC929]|nr:hypothetical protein CHPC929_0054 [Streptococcus phage CHPC929]
MKKISPRVFLKNRQSKFYSPRGCLKEAGLQMDNKYRYSGLTPELHSMNIQSLEKLTKMTIRSFFKTLNNAVNCKLDTFIKHLTVLL